MDQTQHEQKTFLNIDEASEFLNLKKSLLRLLVFKREIPHLKIGSLIRFEKQELAQWINSKRRRL